MTDSKDNKINDENIEEYKKEDVDSEEMEETAEEESLEETLQKDIDHLKDRMMRLQADYENYRRRTEEEKTKTWKLGLEDLATDILPVLDNIERAIESFKEDELDDKHLEGIEMIQNGLLEVLKKHDIEPIVAVGEKFDPNLHHAIQMMDSDEESDTVLIEVNKGYMSEDKVIRPTTVIVSN